jgi:hypothetical protein
VVVAPSFGDIFASNAVNNGLLPARVEAADATALAAHSGGTAQVSLKDLTIALGPLTVPFDDRSGLARETHQRVGRYRPDPATRRGHRGLSRNPRSAPALGYSARGGGPITAHRTSVAHNDGQGTGDRERRTKPMKMHLMAGVVAGATLVGATAQAQQTITAVHAFPETLIYTQSFLSFVDAVNAAGEGVIQIDVRGGPEAIGMFQQPDAVRDGVVDMVYTPGSFYGGALPEKDALVASNLTAIETRENGGIDLIDQIHQSDGRDVSRLVRQRRHLQPVDPERAHLRRRRQPRGRRAAPARQRRLQRLLHQLPASAR